MPATGPLGAASLSSKCCGRLMEGMAGMYGPQECQLAHLHAGCNHCQSGVHHVPKHGRQRLPVWRGQVRTGDPAQTRDASVGSCNADPPCTCGSTRVHGPARTHVACATLTLSRTLTSTCSTPTFSSTLARSVRRAIQTTLTPRGCAPHPAHTVLRACPRAPDLAVLRCPYLTCSSPSA